MGKVMIKCPSTAEPMTTGIRMSAEALETAEMSDNTIEPCPHCGEAHTWDKTDAWVED
jgi:hypothetical protein